ncbi:MAG: CBS domain-containing protein [Deltaproteobacteria bacterium]|nr:CBS domain-containing protein [Deltaproteobacteria bacterium]MBW1873848.1 CBS domain-containing protein [Deltaproteobacteria bacterium]MBW2378058.1 CBS domain-containing protein [Deltaproteobacteria bacterium]
MGSKAPYYEFEIRVRQTLTADGSTSSYSTVYCPPQMRTVRVNECVECEEYIGLSFDREERSGLLHCYESNAPTPRQSLRRLLQAGEREGFLRKLHQRADCTPVSRIMSLNVQCVTEDVSLPALASCLLDGGYSGAPVVDGEGTPVGVVSKTDLLRHGVTPDGRVRDIMTSMSFTLHEDQTVSNASALMAYEGIHRLPVVDAAGKVVGLLSSLDILHWLACKTGNAVPAPRSRRNRN